jgi:hypothetical protein
MKLAIKSMTEPSLEEWDFIWRECSYATYFHSRQWAEIWKDYTDGKIVPAPKLVEFTDGKKVLLPLSLELGKNKRSSRYISSPAGTFGGWIASDPIGIEHSSILQELLFKRIGNLSCRINPYNPHMQSILQQGSIHDETHTLCLLDGFDALYKRWTKGHRSAVTKATREGVAIKLGTEWHEWMQYFEVYKDSLMRWGDRATSRYNEKLFSLLYENSGHNVRLWLAYKDQVLVAGAVCLYSRKHVVYWHGAALQEYFFLRPVNLILYEAIKNACEEGRKWFDFNPSGGHEGVKSFKKSFGCLALPCNVIVNETKIKKLIYTISRIMKLLIH